MSNYCSNCGNRLNIGDEYCTNCGCKIKNNTEVPRRNPNQYEGSYCQMKKQERMGLYTKEKNKTTALVLLLFLGLFGVHHFYCENTTQGVIYLLCSTLGWFILFPPFIIMFMCIVDLIQIICGSLGSCILS